MENIKNNFKLILDGNELFIQYIVDIIRWNTDISNYNNMIDNDIINFCENNIDNVNVVYILSQLYINGNIMESADIKKAQKILNEASGNKSSDTIINLGLASLYNRYVISDSSLSLNDIDKAINLYLKCIENNSLVAMANLAYIYTHSKPHKNYKNAFELYKKSAYGKYVHAEFQLGIMYNNGYGVKKDNDKAIYMYMKAFHNKYNCLYACDIRYHINLIITAEMFSNKWKECEELKKKLKEKDEYIIHLESKPPNEKGLIYEEAELHFESQIDLLKN